MSFGDGEYRAEKAVPQQPIHNYRFAVWVDGELIDVMKVEGLEVQLNTERSTTWPTTVTLTRGVKRGDRRMRELVGKTINAEIEVRTGAQLGHDGVLKFVLAESNVDRHGYAELDAGGNQLLMEFVDLVVPDIKVEDL